MSRTIPRDAAAPERLLVCTTGGSPEPVVRAITHWAPAHVCFFASGDSQGTIHGTGGAEEPTVRSLLAEAGRALQPGLFEVVVTEDHEDLSRCLRAAMDIETVVLRWLAANESREVVADITGGTKAMGAALALVARRWSCPISYVGGRQRTRDGMGVVIGGTEQVQATVDPWRQLGFADVEEIHAQFDLGAYPAAVARAREARGRAGDGSARGQIRALLCISEAYEAWDRFDHANALHRLADLPDFENDLERFFGRREAARTLIALAETHVEHLRSLIDADTGSPAHVLDLASAANRRIGERRFDDGVARLYRATEALAQVALRERHDIESTAAVPITRIPAGLRDRWASRAEDEVLMLGVQDVYLLLRDLGDVVGKRFFALGLDGRSSPLQTRNGSILAHGWTSVGERGARDLLDKLLRLAEIEPARLIEFPRLANIR